MTRFSILMFAAAFCLFRQEANAQTTPSPEDRLLATKVVGRFDMSCAEIPKLDSHWVFTKEGRAIQDGSDMGAWSVAGGKTIITFTDKQFGLAVLSFKNENTLVGKNEHRNGSVFNWVLKREKTEVAQKPKKEPAKPKDDKALLQGRWYAVYEESGGKALSNAEVVKLNKILDVSGDDFRIERTSGEKRGSYIGTMRLGQGDGQKLFDFEGKGPGGSQIELHGIYELTEDVFKVCFSTNLAGKGYTRPLEFRTSPGSGRVFVTFKRSAEKVEVAQKPKEEPAKKEEKVVVKSDGPFQELGRLPMRPDTPWTIAISPDGRLLASGGIGKDKRIYVNDLLTCKPIYTLEGHNGDVSAVVFSLDSKSLYSGSIDGTVREWDMGTGAEKRTIVEAVALNKNKDMSSVFALALSPDGNMLAVGCPKSIDGNIFLVIRLFTVSGKELLAFPTGKELLWGLAFSPNGKLLASAGPNKVAKVWDVATGKELTELKGHKMAVHSVAFSPDGKCLATAGTDKTIKLWKVSSWDEIEAPAEQTLTDSTIHSPAPLMFSPDGRFLAAGGTGDVVQVWDTGTNKKVAAITLPTVMGSGSIVSLAFSSDSSLLAMSSSWDRRIHLWGLERPGTVAARLVNLGYSADPTVTSSQNVRTIFLSELQEENVKVELDWFRKNGTVRMGFKDEEKRDIPVEMKGAKSPHGIFMHPMKQSFASVSYSLRGRYSRFQSTAAIPPVIEGQGDPASPLIFEVRGNGRILWKSRTLKELGQVDQCDIDLEGINRLELRVNCPGKPNWAVAVWLEPRLIQEIVDFSKIDYAKGPKGEKIVERQGFDKEISKVFTEQGFIGLQGQFVRHGKFTNWYEKPMAGKEGKRFSEDYWFNGEAHGKLIMWYESGKLMKETVYEHGRQNGKVRWWYENGKQNGEETYVNDNVSGIRTFWHENGKKQSEGSVLSGKQHGQFTWWHNNGEKMREASYDNGQRNGKFMEWNSKGEKTVELIWASGRILLRDPPSPDEIGNLIQAMTRCELPDVKVSAAVLLVTKGFEDKASIPVLEKGAETWDDAKRALKAVVDVQMVRKLVSGKKARPIEIRIDTATKKKMKLFDFMIDVHNGNLTQASAYATESEVIVQFKVRLVAEPIDAAFCHPLLISIYDKNGFLLTRFETKQEFTPYANTFRDHRGRSEPRLLDPWTNTLLYRVNARDIRDAAIVEVGFIDPRE